MAEADDLLWQALWEKGNPVYEQLREDAHTHFNSVLIAVRNKSSSSKILEIEEIRSLCREFFIAGYMCGAASQNPSLQSQI
jgi:hypothetical protein